MYGSAKSVRYKTVTAIAIGYIHGLAVTSDGKVTAWGDNAQGQSIGRADSGDRSASTSHRGAASRTLIP
ncbi:hypothetical protein [Streptomyces sp. NPDC002346]